MSSHLEFNSISRSYGDAEVLHQISLTVQPSGCVALMGASGCGKTTLLRIAAGLDEPSSGEVLVDGENLTGVPSEERGVALVFQNRCCFPA
ncbi:ATP-binding cassette domain-containing protein [Arthrobacter sp. H20]|uniref:ATP-binding cassette domain-containing protein n=1 Tax=Arthrobacter sp. H20 TaxID=1267981 RepID=UPI0004B2330C|nr:ATP-binding cassette domain-containing protein [Arthrobacter sp. H20]